MSFPILGFRKVPVIDQLLLKIVGLILLGKGSSSLIILFGEVSFGLAPLRVGSITIVLKMKELLLQLGHGLRMRMSLYLHAFLISFHRSSITLCITSGSFSESFEKCHEKRATAVKPIEDGLVHVDQTGSRDLVCYFMLRPHEGVMAHEVTNMVSL